MKQRLRQPLAMLLTVVMLLGLIPHVTFAAEGGTGTENPYAHANHNGDYTAWDNTNALPSNAGTYYLGTNVTISSAWTVPTGGVTLCLNGYNINLSGKNIVVGEDVSLVICDCSKGTTQGWLDENEHLWKPGTGEGEPCNLIGGVIYGGKGSGDGGGAVYVDEGSLTLAGGNLAGNQSGNAGSSTNPYTANGGAVRLEAGSTFTMTGGSITGNWGSSGGGVSASRSTVCLHGGKISHNYARADGGGISAAGETVTMTDGFSITENEAEDDAGGGIYFTGYANDKDPASLTMSGGTVAGNSARTGGGVYIGGSEEGVTFTMNGGTIRENSAKKSGNLHGYGGGVYLARGTFELTDGSIENNTSDNSGGGIYLYRNNYTYNPCLKLSGGTIRGNHAGSSAGGVGYYNAGTPVIELSGAPVVTGNTKGTSKLENNINLIIGVAKLTIAGVLNEGARLGVTPGSRDSDKEFTSGWSSYTHGAGYDTIFTSDDSDFVVLPSDNNELMFHKHYMTYERDNALGKITGTCTCGAEISAWLAGETERTYNGQPQTFEIKTSDNWNDFSDVELKVEYYNYANPEDPAPLTGAPADVGTYLAALSGRGLETAILSFSIKPGTPDLAVTASPSTLSGGGPVTLTVTGAPEGATVTVACDDISIQVKEEKGVWYADLPNADRTYNFTASTTAAGNYASGTASCTVDVSAVNTGGGGVTRYIIEAEAGDGGSISPSGRVSVSSGSDKTFTITADEGYTIANVVVDGKSVGAVSSYTFENVRQNHTIYATFTEDDPVADPDDTGVSGWLNTKEHIQYLAGYPDNSFGPGRNMTRAEAAQMFYNLLVDKEVKITTAFEDVPENAWYATPVNTLASLGIISGVGDKRFEPGRSITRAEFTALAMKFTVGAEKEENIFSDVKPTDWFYEAVTGSIQFGWINGYGDGTFRPNNTITRAEVTAIVNKMLGREGDQAFIQQHQEELKRFTDVTSAHWAYYHIAEATNEHDFTKQGNCEKWSSSSYEK
ncbi:MAG: S-layer homology domain-containing protein [Acutalibacter sp.]